MTARIYLTHDGKTQCIRQWALETGFNQQTLRTRHKAGLSDEKILTMPIRHGVRVAEKRERRKPYQWRTHKTRARELAFARTLATYNDEPKPRDVWDLPMEHDPWGQAACDVAIEGNLFTLNEAGHLMGVSRERIRQIEEGALRKLKRALNLSGDSRDVIELLLRAIETERGERARGDEEGET